MPPLQPTSVLEVATFDPDRPVRLRWKGHTVYVCRLLGKAAEPHLVLMIGSGPPRYVRPCEPCDTRASVEATARAWLNEHAGRFAWRRPAS